MNIKKIFLPIAFGLAPLMANAAQIASTNYVDTAVATKANTQGAGAVEVATVDAAGQYIRSGVVMSDVATTTNVNTIVNNALDAIDLSDKADKATTGDEGNLLELTLDGNYADAGVSATDVSTAVSNMTTLSTTVTNLGTEVDGKADLQAAGTAGSIATVDAAGQYVRSTVSETDITNLITNALTASDLTGLEATTNRASAITAATTATNYPSVEAVRNYALPAPPAACATEQCVLSVRDGAPYWEVVTFPAP
jgi:hypothetical protein